MLNLSSSNEVVLKEFTEDYRKCCYWYFKKMGGERQVQRLAGKLKQQVLDNKADVVGDLVEYLSKNGNHWVACLCGWYREDEPTFTLLAFAYYETIGSYGAFAPIFQNGETYNSNPSGVQILTSHFFLRAKDRLKMKLENKRDLAKAILFTQEMTIRQYFDEPSDEWRVDYQLPQGIARGVIRLQKPLLVEIKTCLSQEALNRKQRRDTQPMREVDRLLPPKKNAPSTAASLTNEARAERMANTRKGIAMLGGSTIAFDLSYDLLPIVFGYMTQSGADLSKAMENTKFIRQTYLPMAHRLSETWHMLDIEQRRDEVSRLIVAVMRDSGLSKTKFSQARAYVLEGSWIKIASKLRPGQDSFTDPHILDLVGR